MMCPGCLNDPCICPGPPLDKKPNVTCPGCGSARGATRWCGCIEYACGATKTCGDYYHGEGNLLDCPEDSSSSHRTGDSGEGVANATGSDAVVPSPPSLPVPSVVEPQQARCKARHPNLGGVFCTSEPGHEGKHRDWVGLEWDGPVPVPGQLMDPNNTRRVLEKTTESIDPERPHPFRPDAMGRCFDCGGDPSQWPHDTNIEQGSTTNLAELHEYDRGHVAGTLHGVETERARIKALFLLMFGSIVPAEQRRAMLAAIDGGPTDAVYRINTEVRSDDTSGGRIGGE